MDFDSAFAALTGNPPFPWQEALFERFVNENIPSSCSLPTGLGKTSVVAVWLIALANHPVRVPRRLVYVVNRRTVVDQTTSEVEKYQTALRDNAGLCEIRQALADMCAIKHPNIDKKPVSPLALSTLRGQFADNREWSADPARPAVIVGTVDMIGSRLLFSGYGVGFKGKPLHAGFLGQDSLLVHDESHLEPAFQRMLDEIQCEQARCKEFQKFHVMQLSATSRVGEAFVLTENDYANAEVKKRIESRKKLSLHALQDEKKLADTIVELAKGNRKKDRAVLIFVRTVDDVERIVKQLPKRQTQQLTGTLRGLERDALADHDPVFMRFLPVKSRNPTVTLATGTVYLVCTSAGEVGVNISADDMVCDLSTFESMAQRFGRVNRFGDLVDTTIDIVHPTKFDDEKINRRRERTLALMQSLNMDGSPKALGALDLGERLAAFAPTPEFLAVSDILFDKWALTTIRDKLPGRPPVEPYLHGISDWEPPQTSVAWRQEVSEIQGDLLQIYEPADLLDDYPLKPHELLKDNSNRVFDRLKRLKVGDNDPIWLVSEDDLVEVTTFEKVIKSGKDYIADKTVLLPPSAGGLEKGFLVSGAMLANDKAEKYDVADELYYEGQRRRIRLWDGDPQIEQIQKSMRLIRTIDATPMQDEMEDEEMPRQLWHWFEFLPTGDTDGSKSNRLPVGWQHHTDDVQRNLERIVGALRLSAELRNAFVFAAKCHDLGKLRVRWQQGIGNPNPSLDPLAKSGGRIKPRELGENYRHEFGSVVDLLDASKPDRAEFNRFDQELQDVVLHLVAVHHGFGRPFFPPKYVFDPEAKATNIEQIASEIPGRYARLQHKYGRWGLAFLESLLRAADYAASASPRILREDLR